MHDPMTVAFEIRRPWPSKKDRTYYPSLFTIWHVDPETDDSDDSCDWFGRNLTPKAKELVKEMVDWDAKFPYYFTAPSSVLNPTYPTLRSIGAGDCLGFVLSIFITAAWRLERRDLSVRDIRNAVSLAVSNGDNLQHSFANWKEPHDAIRFAISAYLRGRRPWYRHPRWHVYHWRIQWHFGQTLHRWLFSRCATCGRRFPWGYSPIGPWNSPKRKWYQGEAGVTHHECQTGNRKTA
jgi:hypothetical protein